MATVADFANLSVDPVNAVLTFGTDDTTSAGVFIGGTSLAMIVIPAGVEGTELSFEVSTDGVIFQGLKDLAGDLITVTFVTGASSNSSHPLTINDFVGATDIKVVTTTAQTANRTFELVPRQV